jgi:transcriptional regulator with XRE-family HTH domain
MSGLHDDESDALGALLPLALRARRRALRLDQRALAAACGVSKSAVARLEKGDTGVSVATLLRVLQAAGLALSIVHADGRPWTRQESLEADLDGATDAAGRRLPGHLTASLTAVIQSWDVTRRGDQLMSDVPRWRYDRWRDQVDALLAEMPGTACDERSGGAAPTSRPGRDAPTGAAQERDRGKRRLVPLTTSEARCCSPA